MSDADEPDTISSTPASILDMLEEAEESPEANDDHHIGTETEGCPLQEPLDALWLEVEVRTRLGAIPLKGVKVTAAGEDWGPSGDHGGFGAPDAPRRKRVDFAAFTVRCVYENAEAKVKREEIDVEIERVTKSHDAIGVIKNRIPNVEDIDGDFIPREFDREFPVTKGRKDYVVLPGVPETEDEPIVRITVWVATFSLNVPYLNQNYMHHTLGLRPGPEKDPDRVSGDVIRDPEEGQEKWFGWILCSPTSATMLANYWRTVKGEAPDIDRGAIIQLEYDQWAERGFDTRLDRKIRIGTSADKPSVGKNQMVDGPAPPVWPDPGAYWMDTAEDRVELNRYRLETREATDEEHLEVLDRIAAGNTGDTDPASRQSNPYRIFLGPDRPWDAAAGDAWVPNYSPNSSTAVEFITTGPEWDFVPEGKWRVKQWGGQEIWKYPSFTAEAAVTHAPEGAEATTKMPGLIGSIPADKITGPEATTQKIADRLEHNAQIDAENAERRARAEAEGRRPPRDKRKKRAPGAATVLTVPLTTPLPGETGHSTVKVDWRSYDAEYPLELLKGYVEGYKSLLARGQPFVTSTTATKGHVMMWRGAVVTETGDVEWLLANDPYGNLASPGSVVVRDFDMHGSVGQYPPNLSEDVKKVQAALAALSPPPASGAPEGEVPPPYYEDAADGAETDELYDAIKAWKKDKYRQRRPTAEIVPGDRYAAELGLSLTGAVGKPTKTGANAEDDVTQLKEFLSASGELVGAEVTSEEVTEALLAALVAYQTREDVRKRIGSSAAKRLKPGFFDTGSRSDSALERLMKKAAGGGYNKIEKSQNESFKTDTEGAKRGMHVYYRNATPGRELRMRIKNWSMGRVEYDLTEEQIAARMTHGA